MDIIKNFEFAHVPMQFGFKIWFSSVVVLVVFVLVFVFVHVCMYYFHACMHALYE